MDSQDENNDRSPRSFFNKELLLSRSCEDMFDASSPNGSEFHEINSRGSRHAVSFDELQFQLGHTSSHQPPGLSMARPDISTASRNELPYFDTFESANPTGPNAVRAPISGLNHFSAPSTPWPTFDVSTVNVIRSPQFDHYRHHKAIPPGHTPQAPDSVAQPRESSSPNEMLKAVPHLGVQISRGTGNPSNREAARKYREKRGNKVADLEQKLSDAEQKIHELEVEIARLTGQIDILRTPTSRRRG